MRKRSAESRVSCCGAGLVAVAAAVSAEEAGRSGTGSGGEECLFYRGKPSALGVSSDAIHCANFGIGLQQRCAEPGVECHVVYPGAKM